MQERKENNFQLVHHVAVVDREIVLQLRHWQVLLDVAVHNLLALVGQLLTVLHGHILDDGLLEHGELPAAHPRHRRWLAGLPWATGWLWLLWLRDVVVWLLLLLVHRELLRCILWLSVHLDEASKELRNSNANVNSSPFTHDC